MGRQEGVVPLGDRFYHPGNRLLQSQFESQAIADRLAELGRTAFSEDDKSFIESAIYFFLATVDEEGRPDCSFKGGPPGFVRVTSSSELAFPDYDGNGMFRSLGNVSVNPNVALLFIAMHGRPRRLRVNGVASVSRSDPLMQAMVGAQMVVRVAASAIFPNCPRYIPSMSFVDHSAYTPRPGQDPVEPEWKGFDSFKDVIHPRQPTWKG
jgi:uncharacterized protein